MWYRESELLQFLPVHMHQGRRRSWTRSIFLTSASFTRDSGKTGSVEVIFTSASVPRMEEKVGQKHVFTSASWGKTGSEEGIFTSASVLDKEEKLDQKHVFTSASWGKTGTKEVIFTSASVLGMEEKLDQKQFALFIRTLKMIYEFYQVKLYLSVVYFYQKVCQLTYRYNLGFMTVDFLF